MNGRHTVLFAAAWAFVVTSAFPAAPTLMGTAALAAASTLLSSAAFAQDRAVPRSGGGGSSRGASSRPSPSSSGSSGVSSRSGGASSSSYRAPSRGLTRAERRHPRAGTGTGARYGGRYPSRPIYPGYPGHPGWGGGWGGRWRGYHPAYWGYWWPHRYYGYYGWGMGGYAPVGSGAVYTYAEPDRGAIRVLVDPTEARVYVDGYYAGVVDDFDGLFQRLHLAPGRHEIRIKLSGYKTYTVRVYVESGTTLKLDHEMEEGFGETFVDLSGGRGAPVREARGSWSSSDPESTAGEEGEPGEAQLRLRVSPDDASVYVDGEFRGTGRDAATLSLAPGSHRIEVVRPGYRTENREVEVGDRAPAEVRIDLERP